MFNIIFHRKIYFLFSGLLIISSILALSFWGLRMGIDFKGGTLMIVSLGMPVDQAGLSVDQAEKKENLNLNEEIGKIAKTLNLGEISVQSTKKEEVLIRLAHISPETHQKILESLKEKFGPIEEKSYQTIGPIIGQELKQKSIWSIVFALILIIIYIAWTFRKVSISSPLASWKYGLIAILALIHDLLVVLGAFSFLGHFFKAEVNSSFIIALLTTLGFSIHDTIVVFDRIRERVSFYSGKTFEEVVNQGVNQTIARSINTSLTVLLVLISLFFFIDNEAIKVFSLALIIGIVIGTYSSIFIASPLLVVWEKIRKKKNRN